jgi:inorganic phosphate transporter, PiT family
VLQLGWDVLLMGTLLVALTLIVAFANGANDVSKGVATLVGSGVTNLRCALFWGTAWTVVGGVAAAFISQGLVTVFSGKGVLATTPGTGFLVAVAAGAIGWLAIATWTGLPVSTTHSLLGGLVGGGIAAQGLAGVRWTAVATKIAVPLAVSPLVALGLMMASYPLIGFAFRRFNRYCVCAEREEPVVLGPVPAAVLAGMTAVRVIAGADCPSAVVTRINAMDSLHWLTAGATSFCRGLNDTPKILALGVLAAAATGIATEWFFLLVALAIGAGSYFSGRRVTEALAEKIATIRHDDGFAANLVTSTLVGFASFHAVPVSTTHVSAGAIMGIGARKAEVGWGMVRDMVAAWVVTVPVAGMVAALAYLAIGRLG